MSGTPPALPPAAQMLQMLIGHWPARALHVFVELGLAEAMGDAPRSADAIAIDTHTHALSVQRLLRALAMLGVVRGSASGGYVLTPLGATLRGDAPDSVREAARLMGSDVHYTAWGALAHSIRTGDAALRHTEGATLFEWLPAHPADRVTYNAWMSIATHMHLPAIQAALNVSQAHLLVDVAGGSGALLAALLDTAPHARGVLQDTQADIVLDPRFVELERAGRATRRQADVFDSLEPGGDIYLMKYLLHAIDDAHAVALLRRCAEALAPRGRVAIVEMLIPEDGAPHRATLMDLNMLVLTDGGRERTEAEYRALCADAGLRVTRVTPTPTPLTVLEAERA